MTSNYRMAQFLFTNGLLSSFLPTDSGNASSPPVISSYTLYMDRHTLEMRWNVLVDAAELSTRKANPALFAIIMGTGGISNLFIAFPYGNGSTPMIVLGLVFFFLNLVLFIVFFVLVTAKYICYPDRWTRLFQNPVISLYAGTFPMGATTLINVAVSVIHEKYRIGGRPFLYFLWAAWWADVVVACLCAWVGVHVMFTNQKHSLESMSAMWLLPVVTLIVASSTGGQLSISLMKYSSSHALETAAVSTFLVTVGFTLAFMVLTGYLMRLVIHGLPVGGKVLSVFLPLGPTGQAGYGILLIGQSFSIIFPPITNTSNSINSSTAGTIIRILCIALAFALWSLATMWLVYAVLAIQSSLRKSLIAFRISFWGLVFPNSVYANLTILLGQTLGSPFLRVWGAIYAIICLLLWASIFLRSLLELRTFFSGPGNADAVTTPVSEEYK